MERPGMGSGSPGAKKGMVQMKMGGLGVIIKALAGSARRKVMGKEAIKHCRSYALGGNAKKAGTIVPRYSRFPRARGEKPLPPGVTLKPGPLPPRAGGKG